MKLDKNMNAWEYAMRAELEERRDAARNRMLKAILGLYLAGVGIVAAAFVFGG